jgi:hypothetical protein
MNHDDDNAPVIPRIPAPRRSPEQPAPPLPPQRDRRSPGQD